MANSEFESSHVAIVGMACRFPGAGNVAEFWQNLRDGKETVTLCESGGAVGILQGADYFDARFFDYTDTEAALMDPQHRLFLECAWEALEHSGCNPETYQGLTGVFAGSGFCSYLVNNLLPNAGSFEVVDEMLVAAGNERDALASTVSYKLNLMGPSLVVQTFCSTALVATHLACQSLITGECDMALAGGVEITFPQQPGKVDGINSIDGHTRSFDARAQGSAKANGVGVVVLMRVEDAISASHCIYGVIKGSAVNNDGFKKIKYLAPGFDGQVAVMIEAIANAGISAETISYLETHGTATLLGDSIEIAAATKAFRQSTDKKAFCAVGSVKTNIGNTERAAGSASIIKTALALHNRELPPSLHFSTGNPDIDFANSPFFVNTKLRDWQNNGHPRRAGVSSFGMGGTNAHVVLEEAPRREAVGPSRPFHLLPLSARTATALDSVCERLAAHLENNGEQQLADVAYTLQVGRKAFAHRRVVIGARREEICAELRATEKRTQYAEGPAPRVVFVFPELSNNSVNLGRELYETEEYYGREVDRRANLIESATRRGRAFILQYALAQLLLHWGVQPATLLGYDVGEYVAAVIASVMPLEDALQFVNGNAAHKKIESSSHLLSSKADCLEKYPQALLLEFGTSGTFAEERMNVLRILPAQDESISEQLLLTESLGKLWLAGVPLNWDHYHEGRRPQLIALPTYPFERQRFWVDPKS
jgi:acyl transferase domain-containing protein